MSDTGSHPDIKPGFPSECSPESSSDGRAIIPDWAGSAHATPDILPLSPIIPEHSPSQGGGQNRPDGIVLAGLYLSSL